MRIIALAGTNGSGKDALGEILAKYHGYLFISMTDILREELKRRSLPIERKNMRLVGNEWRRKLGLGVLIDKAAEIFKSKSSGYKGLVIASLRNPGEVDRVHELGGRVVWLDAKPKVRYQRVIDRKRGTEDRKSYEQFLAEEQAEMRRDGDEATLSLAEVKEMADVYIANNTDSLEDLQRLAEQALGLEK